MFWRRAASSPFRRAASSRVNLNAPTTRRGCAMVTVNCPFCRLKRARRSTATAPIYATGAVPHRISGAYSSAPPPKTGGTSTPPPPPRSRHSAPQRTDHADMRQISTPSGPRRRRSRPRFPGGTQVPPRAVQRASRDVVTAAPWCLRQPPALADGQHRRNRDVNRAREVRRRHLDGGAVRGGVHWPR